MILALAVLAGCGPGRRAAVAPVEPPAPLTVAPAPEVVDGGAAAAPQAVPAPITDDECGQLVDKLIAIGLAEQRVREPRAPQATGDQQATIRAQLLAQALPTCATLPRARWDCAIAAGDRAAMMVCEAAASSAAP